jgi:hypothetical protein
LLAELTQELAGAGVVELIGRDRAQPALESVAMGAVILVWFV